MAAEDSLDEPVPATGDKSGLLPESYSDPEFPAGGSLQIEFEENSEDKIVPRDPPKSAGGLRGQPGGKGSCEPYVGTTCDKYVGSDYVYIGDGLTQTYIEQGPNFSNSFSAEKFSNIFSL
jgi:hypothetical protein